MRNLPTHLKPRSHRNATQRKTMHGVVRCHACYKRMYVIAEYMQENTADDDTCESIAADARLL